MTVLSFPIGVINALRIAAIAARPFATVQALIPAVQLGVLIIVGASVTDCKNRQYDNEYSKRCMPKVIVHLAPNPNSACVLYGDGEAIDRLKEYFVTSFSTMRDVDASYDHEFRRMLKKLSLALSTPSASQRPVRNLNDAAVSPSEMTNPPAPVVNTLLISMSRQ
ncbi:hypothetical protein [Bradyrhizobium liaoningense]|uniref:hypothetical protein n=1 Tax=Bradyrhizobium liaoningense TaxID=43992 RepID=UPI001BAD3F29|nr:hypothetical protein [Bradyrhizobium liaoningense]MBR0817364.1 hypothetical protein [Bradyrhizobium liaoningense]